jgi:hypothetical protein
MDTLDRRVCVGLLNREIGAGSGVRCSGPDLGAGRAPPGPIGIVLPRSGCPRLLPELRLRILLDPGHSRPWRKGRIQKETKTDWQRSTDPFQHIVSRGAGPAHHVGSRVTRIDCFFSARVFGLPAGRNRRSGRRSASAVTSVAVYFFFLENGHRSRWKTWCSIRPAVLGDQDGPLRTIPTPVSSSRKLRASLVVPVTRSYHEQEDFLPEQDRAVDLPLHDPMPQGRFESGVTTRSRDRL